MSEQLKELTSLARVAPIVDLIQMSNYSVAIIGLGTGGSRIASELARCGIKKYHVFDPEKLAIENISRHIGGISQVGQSKVDVVTNALKEINNEIIIEKHYYDVLKYQKDTINVLSNVDIIIESTGRASVGHFISKCASDLHKPATFGGVYARGIGGYVLKYKPGTGDPCYTCVFTRLKAMEKAEVLTPQQISAYSDANNADELKAEPSLSVHIWYIILLQTRMSLDLLFDLQNPNVKRPLESMPGPLILWANERWSEMFTKPLTYKTVQMKRDPHCPSCSESRPM